VTFSDLLMRLESRCQCRVTKQDAGGIPDTDDSVSGELYLVERGAGASLRFAFIEIYHHGLPVKPDHLQSICAQLGIDEDRLTAPH
jgi:hypothetical protein